jgi:CBS domain-containing protein
MLVRELMTRAPEACGPNTNLAAAAMIMWRHDCGAVPVVDPQGKALGMITDRDICMALATRHLRAEEIEVGQVISGRLVSIPAGEDARTALDLMRLEQVRRLPVVREDDTLLGIVSMNDLVLHAGRGHGHHGLSADAIVQALKGICEHRVPPLAKVEPPLEPDTLGPAREVVTAF